MHSDGYEVPGFALIAFVLVGVLAGILGTAVFASEQEIDRKVAQCEAANATPLVDDSRVLCFNPQVVQEVR